MSRSSRIVGLNGRALARCGVTLEQLEQKIGKEHPEWPLAAVRWEADRMFDRLEDVHEVIDAGAEQDVGRVLRLRWTNGLGIETDVHDADSAEMRRFKDLLRGLRPEERGFVLSVLKQKVCA